MLRCPGSAAAHQSAAIAFNVEDGGRRVSPISIGLREQCADRSACILGKNVYSRCLMPRSARVIYGLRRFDHVSNALMPLHWLRIPERIQFKLAVLVHRVLHGNAPEYLGAFTRLCDVPSRLSLRSASSNHLLIPPVRRSTFGARAFTVSGPALWNSLPSDITSIDSLPVFHHCTWSC